MSNLGWLVLLLVNVVACASLPRSFLKKLPEESMNVTEMVNHHKYPCERHYVQTKDGFILTLHRIPYGIKKTTVKQRQPVFLQHGILDSSATFLMNSPSQSLGFVLADAGYDVWLGNSRGNTYSDKHVKYSVNDVEFWDFSFDDMAQYDLPASIDYILEKTNKPDLYYIGHSQGTTIGFAAFGENKELASKIRAFITLAPVATVKHIKGAIKMMSTFTAEAEFFFKLFGIKEFLPSSSILRFVAQDVCGLVKMSEKICGSMVFLLAGFDTSNMDDDRLPVYLSHLPAGTSTKDMIHYAQMVNSGKFQKFDYGSDGNVQHYGQTIVPVYNMSNVDVPVALFTGTHDWLADPTDIDHEIRPYLPNIIHDKNIDQWNHLDFVWGIDANKVIYQDIINLMDKRLQV